MSNPPTDEHNENSQEIIDKNVSSDFKKKIMEILRDPIWQFIGAVLAIAIPVVAFIYNFYLPNIDNGIGKNSKIMIGLTSSKSITTFPSQISSRTKVYIDGKEEEDVQFESYVIYYDGDKPLKKEDFVNNLRGTVGENRKILGIQKSSYISKLVYREKIDSTKEQDFAPVFIDLEGIINESKSFNAGFKIIDEKSLEINTDLINPNEAFGIDVYTSKSLSQKNLTTTQNNVERINNNPIGKELDWSCRVAGVECPITFDGLYNPENSKLNDEKNKYFGLLEHNTRHNFGKALLIFLFLICLQNLKIKHPFRTVNLVFFAMFCLSAQITMDLYHQKVSGYFYPSTFEIFATVACLISLSGVFLISSVKSIKSWLNKIYSNK